MKRLASIAACAVLSVGTLSACGGGEDEYCSQIKKTQDSIGDISGAEATSADFQKATDSINKIADEAPDSVKDDWKTIGTTLQNVLDAVEGAGLKIEDLQDPQKAQELSAEDQKKITDAAQDMSKVTDAQDKITKQVKEECDIDLGSTSGSGSGSGSGS